MVLIFLLRSTIVMPAHKPCQNYLMAGVSLQKWRFTAASSAVVTRMSPFALVFSIKLTKRL
jgi:hypothetical protein